MTSTKMGGRGSINTSLSFQNLHTFVFACLRQLARASDRRRVGAHVADSHLPVASVARVPTPVVVHWCVRAK